MKIIAKKEAIYKNKEGSSLLVLEVENIRHQLEIEGIKDDLLSVEIKKARNKRSNEQNRLMWALLSDIDKAINGERSNDSWQIYLNALLRAGTKCEYIVAKIEAEDSLKRTFRALEWVRDSEQDGYAIYRVYLGSSTFNTKEMTNLIETVLDMAEEAGVETDYWREVLR